jgi:hypothetical protein
MEIVFENDGHQHRKAPVADRGVTVTAYRERFMTCGSCRAPAVAMVWVGDKRFATCCQRHTNTWKRRAERSIS